MRTHYLILIFLTFTACHSGNQPADSRKNNDSLNADAKVADQLPAESRIPVASDENTLITETRRPGMLLYGQYIVTDALGFYPSVQIITPGIMRGISNAGAVISGPMVYYYDEIPRDPENIRIFIGIPVKNKFRNEGDTKFVEIQDGIYFKMECNADAGQTIPHHKKMQQILSQKQLKFANPIFEIASESRNSEMTVETKMSLYYLKK